MSDFKKYLLDPSIDYRKRLVNFRLNKRGDLLIKRFGQWECLIEKERMTEPDWIAHLVEKQRVQDFGEFVCAYLKALERMGVTNLNISLYGFDYAFKYADSK